MFRSLLLIQYKGGFGVCFDMQQVSIINKLKVDGTALMFWFLWVLYCTLLVKVAIHLVCHVFSRIKIVILDLFVFTCFFEGRLRMWGYIISYLTQTSGIRLDLKALKQKMRCFLSRDLPPNSTNLDRMSRQLCSQRTVNICSLEV